MPQPRSYNLFISHAWDYDDDYYRLENLLTQASYFWWNNLIIPSHDGIRGARTTQDIARVLEDQIRPADCVLIVSGMYCAHRDWIQAEIDMAPSHQRPIIGIYLWGQERTPIEVQDVAWEMVGWNTASIVGAIRRHCR
jgi:MTH538 TIR-like domain (DUF1863)